MLIEKRHEKRMKKGRGLGQFADLRGGLGKKEGGAFERGRGRMIPQYTL